MMNLLESFKTKYDSVMSIASSQKTVKIMTVALLCLTVIGMLVVIIYVTGIQSYDALVLLNGFRLLLLSFVLATGGVFAVLVINRAKMEWLFLALALGIGISYMFAMTPLAGVDEPHHYFHSTHLSSLFFGPNNITFSRASDFDFGGLSYHNNVPSAYLRLIEEGIRPTVSEFSESYRLFEDILYPAMHLPQAIGVSIGRLLQLNFFGVFYLGRLFNLLLFVLCGFFAIRSLKEFKLPLLIICLFPMSLQQAASFSYDSFINGASILLIAYIVRCIYERDEWSYGDIAVIAVAGILLAPAKTVYTIILFLLLFAAPFKYGWKKPKGYIIAIAICAAAIGNIIFFNFANLQSTLESAPVERWHGGTNFTLSFIYENPWETILIFIRTIAHQGNWLFFGVFGQELGGFTLGLPDWQIHAFILVLAASVFYGEKGSWIPSWWHKAVYFGVFSAVVLMSMLGMFLAWTPDTHRIILGLQGRYFIPVVPLAMLILRNRLMISKPHYANLLISLVLLTHFFIIRHILDFTIGRL